MRASRIQHTDKSAYKNKNKNKKEFVWNLFMLISVFSLKMSAVGAYIYIAFKCYESQGTKEEEVEKKRTTCDR